MYIYADCVYMQSVQSVLHTVFNILINIIIWFNNVLLSESLSACVIFIYRLLFISYSIFIQSVIIHIQLNDSWYRTGNPFGPSEAGGSVNGGACYIYTVCNFLQTVHEL